MLSQGAAALYFAAWPSFSSRWSLVIIRAMPSRARRRRPFLLIHGTPKSDLVMA